MFKLQLADQSSMHWPQNRKKLLLKEHWQHETQHVDGKVDEKSGEMGLGRLREKVDLTTMSHARIILLFCSHLWAYTGEIDSIGPRRPIMSQEDYRGVRGFKSPFAAVMSCRTTGTNGQSPACMAMAQPHCARSDKMRWDWSGS